MLPSFIAAAVVSTSGFGGAVVELLVFGIIIGVLWWAINAITLIPAIVKQVLQALLVVGIVVVLINFLMSLTGHSFIVFN
jgi:uncharacterized membrane protein YwzB